MNVLDASALLAFLLGEPGEAEVEAALVDGAICGAANWSEVAQKIRSRGRDWDLVRTLLKSYGLEVEPVTERDADWAAQCWQPGQALSLADRLCLALSARLDVPVLTADASWGTEAPIRQIR